MGRSSSLVYKTVSLIPRGKVTTYGQIAKLVGIRNPMAVGNILHKNSDPKNIPCYKVVNSEGKVARRYGFGGGKEQIELLEKDGVVVKNGRVDLEKYIWRPKAITLCTWRCLKFEATPRGCEL